MSRFRSLRWTSSLNGGRTLTSASMPVQLAALSHVRCYKTSTLAVRFWKTAFQQRDCACGASARVEHGTDYDWRNLVFQSTDLADRLAMGRTILAYERTFTAWIRTGLASLAAGIGTHVLLNEEIPWWIILSVATVLILFSAFCFFAAATCERRISGLESGEIPQLPASVVKATTYVLAAIAGAVLVGVWMV